MDIQEYVSKKFDLHPFLIELMDKECMWRYWALIALEKDRAINSLENKVKEDDETYNYLSLYTDSIRKDFKIKEGDKIILQQIALDLKMKCYKDFLPSNKPAPPAKSGYKLLDLLNLHIWTGGARYSDELKQICLLLYLKGGKYFFKLLSDHYKSFFLQFQALHCTIFYLHLFQFHRNKP